MPRTVRQATAADREAVVAFTADTWSDRDVRDYIPDVFDDWVAGDDETQHTAVVAVDGTAVGIAQATLLTGDEAWLQGIRIDPAHRGADHGRALTEHLVEWCRERGATVARNMVFGWNPAGMGQSRAVGMSPATACRWARPAPDADANPAATVVDDATRAWRFWTHSDARTELGGLTLDAEQAWALAELTRDRLDALAADGRVFAVVDGGTRAMAARIGTRERDGETAADYAVGAWADAAAAAHLFDAIRADAADCGADGTRVCIPDTTRFVSDAALAGATPSDNCVFVFAADLTDDTLTRR
jgi:GNAT superfamily N-acetyltransferase